ncbi:Thioesterase superfamily [Penicillium camemberti]|uniref:Thioesterase superfamily n=1 Tax=Penicillium camemberti (strain FM 013) TaxID=1429867 RepID=A0A0G4PC62_PENC3|nr:Thioesterase superfamily [Penicillium camemberti]
MASLKFVRSVWESFRATSGLEPRYEIPPCYSRQARCGQL